MAVKALIGQNYKNYNVFRLVHIILIIKLIKEEEWIIFNHLYQIKAYLKAFNSTYLGLVFFKLRPSIGPQP